MSYNIVAIGDFATGPVTGAEFIRLAGPNHALPPPPRFLFGTVPAAVLSHYFGLLGLSSVGVFRLTDFELQGAFLLRTSGKYYRCPELNVHEAHIDAEAARTVEATSNTPRHLEGLYVVLAGPGYKVYGHWLAEYLPKIGLLKSAGYDIFALRYLLPSDAPGYVQAWLALLGIDSEQIILYNPKTEVIAAQELMLPTVMHNGARMSPLFGEATSFLRGLLAAGHDLTGSVYGSRILLSRTRASQGRRLKNRERIEELAASARFAIVSPEELSLLDQVRLFVGARAIIGEYGSALHGSIFSPAGTVVCALRGTGRHPGFLQSGIGAAMAQPTGYIFGTVDDPEPNASVEIDETAMIDALRLVFGGAEI